MRIIGHGEVTVSFDRLIAAGRIGHAYLLVGPEGVGKATIATWVAQRLLCQGQVSGGRCPASASPHEACASCQHVERGVHPDVFRVSTAPTIGIEDVREWTASLSRSSLFAGWKVGILEGATRLTEAAANATLKAIEEPTPRTLILLTASSRRAVLPTIVSRCGTVILRRVPRAELVEGLRARGLSSSDVVDLVGMADGCPGAAIMFSVSPERRQRLMEQRDVVRAALTGAYADRLKRLEVFFRKLPSDRTEAHARVVELLEAIRDFGRALVHEGSITPTPEAIRWLSLLVRAPRYLAANVAPRLLLETLVVTAPTLFP